jgi:excisionase family DNA binding protein
VNTLPELLTSQEVAAWLSLPTARVEKLARRGDIPALRLPGGDLAFDKADLVRWLDKLRRGPQGGHCG